MEREILSVRLGRRDHEDIAESLDRLRAIPYGEVYAEWLDPAAGLLREAADLTESPSLKAFLRSRAEAF